MNSWHNPTYPEVGKCRYRLTPKAIPKFGDIMGWDSVNRPRVRIGVGEEVTLPREQVEVQNEQAGR